MESAEHNKLDFAIFLRTLRRFWLLILFLSIAGAAAGCVISVWVIKPQYQATALIFAWADAEDDAANMADPQKEEVGEDQKKPGETSNDRIKPVQDLQIQKEMALAKLRNYQMLYHQLTVGNLLMPDFQALLNSNKMRSKINEELRKKYPGRPLEKFRLSARALPKTRFVEVSVYCYNKKMAPEIANVVVSIFTREARELLGVNNTQIIDKASISVKMNSRPGLFIFGGLIAGLLLGMVLAFLLDFIDKSIRDLKELEAQLGMPVLGVLPEVVNDNDGYLWGGDTKNTYGEAVRSLRVNVEYLLPETGRAKIFLISSVNKGDGKSSVMANLALSFAQIEKRVLLLDADLRRPRQHRIFKLSNKEGLVDMLVSKKSFEDIVHSNVKVKGLDVICCGTIPMNPTDLLAARRLEEFLNEQAQKYDYIFVDAPPALGFVDPLILGNLADSTILACDYRKSNTDKIRMIIDRLRKANVRVGGVVVNRFQLLNRSDYYYNYQHYYYQYQPDEDIDDTKIDETSES